MADGIFATNLANNYVNDNGGIEESLMAGGDTGVGQAGGAAGVASGNEGVSGVVSGNGGVTVGPTQPGGPSPAQGQISQNIKSKLSGEDPLFTAMAGNNTEFIHGLPRSTWDKMAPKEQEKWRVLEKYSAEVQGLGAVAGGMPGVLLGMIPGMEVPGGAAALFGELLVQPRQMLGYIIKTKLLQGTTFRNNLRRLKTEISCQLPLLDSQ